MSYDSFLSKVNDLIKSRTGIKLTGSHDIFVSDYIQKEISRLSIDYERYLSLITNDEAAFSSLVNATAINETYFFREEKQFRFLEEVVLPSFLLKNRENRQLVIWSASCSTGEEPLSLYLITKKFGLNPIVFASDIDTEALQTAKSGVYSFNSLRKDGECYHELVEKYSKPCPSRDGYIQMDEDVLNKLTIVQYNLNSCDPVPLSELKADIIFIRNTFIYFEAETKLKILSKLASCLNDGGYLFFSMSEISAISAADGVPLEKQKKKGIFFFRKTDGTVKQKVATVKQTDGTVKQKVATVKQTDGTVKQKVAPQTKPTIPTTKSTTRLKAKSKDNPEKCFETIKKLLDAGKTQDAVECAKKFDGGLNNKSLACYFIGYTQKGNGEIFEACEAFEKAVLINPAFWPGYFQLGIMLSSLKPEKSFRALSKCAELLDKYIDNKSTTFDFLMESFNPCYFRTMCLKYIGKGIN